MSSPKRKLEYKGHASFAIHETFLPVALIIELKCYQDSRGFLIEVFKQSVFAQMKIPHVIVQENHSPSHKGVLRGLHYQLQPYAQGKLIYCIVGQIFDVLLDLRRNRPTLGKHFAVELGEHKAQMLWVPPGGFAHEFYTLSEKAHVIYKIFGSEYFPQAERSIRWNDPQLGIPWPLYSAPMLSPKDAQAPFFKEAEYNFDHL